ncbi:MULTISPECIES: lysozyme [unclassified Gilliamella]|uniref:lysozyme n=1 Tax=unclassified Gilliamella TaxID=2685620 RepID=UPI000812CB8C|nr:MULTISPECIES: lysozyme [Gilliamella]MCX8738420.1 lysozyme [Gilliamella sp. B2824]OCL21314.1 lysozyme [Gilliamella apicola]
MIISEKGLELIKSFESLAVKAYKCPAGIWTIGYGHTKNVKENDRISQAQAECFLMQDLYPVEQSINKLVKVKLNQNQYDALCSFVFNVGVSAFNQSTLLAKLNIGDYLGASKEFCRWNKITVNGVKQSCIGLANRRQAEEDLFNHF